MSTGELACTYAALILHDDGIDITAEKISTLVKTANLNIESYWPSLFAKLCQNKNIDDLIMNAGAGGSAAAPMAVSSSASAAGGATQAAAPAAEEKKKEEVKEESDDDFVSGLFD
ncbi:Large ribosomal subunit protein P1w [Cardamine amara subsp. amara]|uniref:Large ribosomal subunit protein P1w n=1 Tax=Cardamine amara subsp. amara TaxID=228776 RepID=A0ABD1AB63_CARAN